MKKIIISSGLTLIISSILCAQTTINTGKPIAEIFTDFHYNFNDTSKTTGFGLNRAYFGYNFIPGDNFSAKIIFNAGSPDDLVEGSEPRRYAFFREASLSYSKDKLTLTMGITGTQMYEFQQRFWGKRYLANTYQSLNCYGFVADLGLMTEYRFSSVIKSIFSVMNGEGYSNIQLDNNIKASTGIEITPTSQLAFRVFGDITKVENIWQSTLIGFAGFKYNIITFGAEFSHKTNLDSIGGHHAWGISTTGSLRFSETGEFFVRYDHSASIIPNGRKLQWNYPNDGDFLIAGIQYTLSSNVKIAINYQGTYPYFPDRQPTDAIFLNAHFKF
jgi:hypothetical protein